MKNEAGYAYEACLRHMERREPIIRLGHFSLLHEQENHGGQDDQKSKVQGGKQPEIFQCFALNVRGILTEGDQACQRGDQRADTADVYAQQKVAVIRGEFRQQNGGGDVADDLTGKDARQERAFFQQCGEEPAHNVDSGYVARDTFRKKRMKLFVCSLIWAMMIFLKLALVA